MNQIIMEDTEKQARIARLKEEMDQAVAALTPEARASLERQQALNAHLTHLVEDKLPSVKRNVELNGRNYNFSVFLGALTVGAMSAYASRKLSWTRNILTTLAGAAFGFVLGHFPVRSKMAAAMDEAQTLANEITQTQAMAATERERFLVNAHGYAEELVTRLEGEALHAKDALRKPAASCKDKAPSHTDAALQEQQAKKDCKTCRFK